MPAKEYKNAKRGNVYAIHTAVGYGFFQCVGKYEQGIDIIRVLRPILPSVEDFQPLMAREKGQYFTKMLVDEAERRKIITLVGSCQIPRHGRTPTKYRWLVHVPHRNIHNWYEICQIRRAIIYCQRVSTLTDRFLALSPNGIWNPAFLRDRIEEGWTLQDWR